MAMASLLPAATIEAIRCLRDVISRRLGLALSERSDEELASILEQRRRARRLDLAAYLRALDEDDVVSSVEIQSLAELVTVGETYFFRNRASFDALRVALESIRFEATENGEVAILSAGASTGEEAYSIAILIQELEAAGKAKWLRARVKAYDLNPRSIATAQAGVYSEWSLREVDSNRKARFFTRQARNRWAVSPTLKSTVDFEQRNLTLATATSHRERFHVIFCRNMLMYFTPDAMQRVIRELHEALVPGGLLFLGHAETLRGRMDGDLEAISTHDTFYYRRKHPHDRPPAPVPVPPPPTLPPLLRVAAPPTLPPPPKPEPKQDPLELLRQERFNEVLVAEDADGVVRAAAQLGLGAFDAAIASATDVLSSNLEHHEPDAHVLLGLAAEHHDRRTKALEHYRAAIYLDPLIAAAHLYLGRLHLRQKENDAAKHILQQALELMKRESDRRVAIFGGGFSREGLIGQCESLLKAIPTP